MSSFFELEERVGRGRRRFVNHTGTVSEADMDSENIRVEFEYAKNIRVEFEHECLKFIHFRVEFEQVSNYSNRARI